MLLRPNYPHNCFTLEISGNREMKRDGGPKQVLFYFHPLPGYGVEIQIEDQKRSCFRLIKENRLSQAGPLIDIEDIVEKADHKYIIELSH